MNEQTELNELSKLDEQIIKDIVEVKLSVINLRKLVDELDKKLTDKVFNKSFVKGGEVVDNKPDTEYVVPQKCIVTPEQMKSLLDGNKCKIDMNGLFTG